VVLVEASTNVSFKYTSTVQYDSKRKNVFWGITKDGKIAYIKGDDFKTIESKSAKQKIKMHVTPTPPLETYEEIKNFLFKAL
jgi:hypothetical protein